jgi:phenol hydroxylase P5 protein
MILELLANGCEQPITLVYGQRSREELYYDDEFRALAAQHPHFTYIPAISGEDCGDWQGARGFVHEAAQAHFKAALRVAKPICAGHHPWSKPVFPP